MVLMTASVGIVLLKWWPLMLRYALVLSAGLSVGWWVTDSHYNKKIMRELISQQEAYEEQLNKQAKRTEHYKSISEKYYADYQDAINREPSVVTERVFVRAHCPTNATADSGGNVGNGAAPERVELHAETVASATRVTDQAERDVLSCRAALHSLQRKIRAHNELQR